MIKIFLFSLFFLLSIPISFSYQDINLSLPKDDVKFSLPLVEAPFNFMEGSPFPGMNQSLNLTANFYQIAHYAFLKTVDPDSPVLTAVGIFGMDVLLSYLPLGDSWLHEEWHRAVLSRRNIPSYNEVYDFKFFADLIKVKHVSDENLSRLKRHHPKEMVRMSSAGMEAQNHLVLKFEKEIFFENRNFHYGTPILLNTVSNIYYMETCRSYSRSERSNRDSFNQEGSNIQERDFTGLDCLGYVYDLFRPNEAYSNRGVHPSGVGVKRYISFSDLSDDEKSYLKRVTKKTYLNLINPFLFLGSRSFEITNNLSYNFSLREYLTSFGDSLDLNLFFNYKDSLKGLIIFHHYSNYRHQFLGIETELHYQYEKWQTEMRIMGWDQPSSLDVWSKESKLGGLLGTQVSYTLFKNIWPYLGVDIKSEGFVAGNPFLDSAISSTLGIIIKN